MARYHLDDSDAMAEADRDFRRFEDGVWDWMVNDDQARSIVRAAMRLVTKKRGSPQWETALGELDCAVRHVNNDYIDAHYKQIQDDVRSGRRNGHE